jgi:hypothetical protein
MGRWVDGQMGGWVDGRISQGNVISAPRPNTEVQIVLGRAIRERILQRPPAKFMGLLRLSKA